MNFGASMTNQWENFLQNLGTWRGSFTTMTLAGEVLKDIPSILEIQPVNGDRQHIQLDLNYFASGGYDGAPTKTIQQNFQSLSPLMAFAETGAFSIGPSAYFGVGTFVAEFNFVAGDRRQRMVHFFDVHGNFEKLVLIREFREGTPTPEKPPLTVDQLVGTWAATSYTYGANLPNPVVGQSQLQFKIVGDYLQQSIDLEQRQIQTKALIVGNNQLKFTSDNPRQITLLPDGGSINVPLKLSHSTAFFVEVGWLLSPNLRQRIMRNYDASGKYTNSTFITEKRIA